MPGVRDSCHGQVHWNVRPNSWHSEVGRRNLIEGNCRPDPSADLRMTDRLTKVAVSMSVLRVLRQLLLLLASVTALATATAQAVTLSEGDLLVADVGLDALFRVDPTTGNRTVVSGMGVGFGTGFIQPRGIYISPQREIFVTDATQLAVMRVDA